MLEQYFDTELQERGLRIEISDGVIGFSSGGINVSLPPMLPSEIQKLGELLVAQGIKLLYTRNFENCKIPKGIEQWSLKGELIARYRSLGEASRCTGIDVSSISLVSSGKRKTAGGFYWKEFKIEEKMK